MDNLRWTFHGLRYCVWNVVTQSEWGGAVVKYLAITHFPPFVILEFDHAFSFFLRRGSSVASSKLSRKCGTKLSQAVRETGEKWY